MRCAQLRVLEEAKKKQEEADAEEESEEDAEEEEEEEEGAAPGAKTMVTDSLWEPGTQPLSYHYHWKHVAIIG